MVLKNKTFYEEKNSPSLDTLIDMIYNELNLSVKKDTLYRIIKNSKTVKKIDVTIMEPIRADVSIEDFRIIMKN